ncbi:hypothetical protein CRE_10910 [Caenorhabditis remanei]|uniref:Uncharacterized protein n=1 Tax=Caenorhabditis remanei TaxID=31234 RepID=E3M5H3_CAERE|nr:hypothetical protein CRE_10910 [Caenorhabditis remanei]
MPGTLRSYYSLDEISNKDGKPEIRDSMHFTTEFLNKMTPSGMPPHELRLKKGGNRHAPSESRGQTVLILRIKLNYEKNLPFTMSRLQFPLRLSFAMTINNVALFWTTTREGIHIQAQSGVVNNVVFKEVLL